jgi:hypothetical protein
MVFVTSHDRDTATVHVALPDGLVELFLAE